MVAVGIAIVIGLSASRAPQDGLFRGQLESEWIKALKYNDSAQLDQWRGGSFSSPQIPHSHKTPSSRNDGTEKRRSELPPKAGPLFPSRSHPSACGANCILRWIELPPESFEACRQNFQLFTDSQPLVPRLSL